MFCGTFWASSFTPAFTSLKVVLYQTSVAGFKELFNTADRDLELAGVSTADLMTYKNRKVTSRFDPISRELADGEEGKKASQAPAALLLSILRPHESPSSPTQIETVMRAISLGV